MAPLTSPPALQEAVRNSTAVWQANLRALFLDAKDRFPDVVWELTADSDEQAEVWGHKGLYHISLPSVAADVLFQPSSTHGPLPAFKLAIFLSVLRPLHRRRLILLLQREPCLVSPPFPSHSIFLPFLVLHRLFASLRQLRPPHRALFFDSSRLSTRLFFPMNSNISTPAKASERPSNFFLILQRAVRRVTRKRTESTNSVRISSLCGAPVSIPTFASP
jgi:hypothetical protein